MMMAGLVAHAATRGAVKAFTQGLSEEMRRRDITAISAQSNEIVEAWHITGANLTVDGGTKG